ncbi:hypothetical protein AB0I84_13210 [Streptomyces spectabilis]|uniref:hypothetical protein n=1 Tax=Streptomyces spectabilis TaxID=68270 RepID=UPI0033EBF027
MSSMTNWPAWVSSGAAVSGAGAAWFAAYNGVRTLRQTRTDSIGRSRPMVAAELRAEEESRSTLYLIIRNYGPSLAHNVQVSFSPEIPDPAPEKAHESIIPYLKSRYAEPIKTLTPGTELRNVYFAGVPGPDNQFVNYEDVPAQVTVTITYESTESRETYTDSYDLDIDLLKSETYVTSSTSMKSQVTQIRKALQGAEKELGEIARAQTPRQESTDS